MSEKDAVKPDSAQGKRPPVVSKQRRNRWLFLLVNITGGLLLGVALWLALPHTPWLSTALVVALIAALIAIVLLAYRVYQTQINLRRRLKEISTLNQISQILRSTLELDNLLAILQLQVRQFLGVDNFYVALYNQIDGRLWYPMAVKGGLKVYWPARQLTDRLTDRVIRERQSILLAHHAQMHLSRIGLPVGEDAPYAWMGVPLIASERVIGCLAAFTLKTDIEFTRADLNLLETISGQVGVAIENALLHEQVQQRTSQLETMNQIAALTNGGVNMPEALDKVCQSITDAAGALHSAIFILNQEYDEIVMAASSHLSQGFIQTYQRMPVIQDAHTRCLRTGQPSIIADLMSSNLDPSYVAALSREGIRASGDFPLITPEGQVGYLSVYYAAPHAFSNEEIELLQTFAAQAALVVSNARLHAQSDLALARRANQLTILETIGRQLAAAIRSNHLFEIILDYALEFTHSRWGNIAIYNPQKHNLEFKAWRGYSVNPVDLPATKGLCGKAVLSRQPINSPDVTLNPEFLDFTNGEARSQLSIPLLHEEQVLGVLTLENPQLNAYSAHEQAFVAQLANQAAVALTNALLYSDVVSGRERLSAIINSTREGIFMVDTSGQVTLANASFQKMASLALTDLVGKQLTDLPLSALHVLGFTHEQTLQIIDSLRQGVEPACTPEIIYPDEPRRVRVLERFPALVHRGDGDIAGWMVVVRDISEEQALTQTREFITETLVHDLRSPMSAVLGALNVIEETCHDSEHSHLNRAVEIAGHGAQRALRLVEAMLDIARLETGQEQATLDNIDLMALSRDVVGEFTTQCHSYGITLNNLISEDCTMVKADALKVSRVLANLLDNAVKFTPRGGEIVISAAQVGDEVQVCVSDTGPGVPPEYGDKIFERFSQVPGQMGRRRGSGLGLAFCKLAMEAQGGRIWVETPPEGGSRFVFTLKKM
ncbi:MAG: GAF domain-containing protein [Anaerolineales bacterium]|nr:GAF domain-containing protein [Anaerolineales bacterium]